MLMILVSCLAIVAQLIEDKCVSKLFSSFHFLITFETIEFEALALVSVKPTKVD